MKFIVLCLVTCSMCIANTHATKPSDSNSVKTSLKPSPKRVAAREGNADSLPGESPNPFTGLRYTNEDLEQMRARARVQAEIAGQNAQYEQSMLQVEESRKKREQLKRFGITNPQPIATTGRALPNDLIGNVAGGGPAGGIVRPPTKPAIVVPQPTVSVSTSAVLPRPSFVVGVIGTHTENLVIREGAAATQSDNAQTQRALLQLRPASTVGRVQIDNREPVALNASNSSAGLNKPAPETPVKAESLPSVNPAAPGAMSSGPPTTQASQ